MSNQKKQDEKSTKDYFISQIREKEKRLYLSFNLGFTEPSFCDILDSNDGNNHHKQLHNRMIEMSSIDMVELLMRRKTSGLEKIDSEKAVKTLKVKSIKGFGAEETRGKLAGKDWWFMRLYTNNNPLPARVVGKLINQTFYPIFIRLDHSLD
ncbi:hypothetical protein [Leuconostoc fallax]|uniref:hypothetical protein n=1 Tax=Leuconostoc fallax TaxID=1251 RepID=UPI001C1ECF58|nr:hypothetical protein [Leuconostoc fallax]MBU7455663.1 hypothetical protein [Leuconostoc fallax]